MGGVLGAVGVRDLGSAGVGDVGPGFGDVGPGTRKLRGPVIRGSTSGWPRMEMEPWNGF